MGNGFVLFPINNNQSAYQSEERAEGSVFQEHAGGAVEEQRVEQLGGGEAFAETFGDLALDGFAGFGPSTAAVCVRDEMGEGGFGSLEGHGHAVAGEGRDDGM